MIFEILEMFVEFGAKEFFPLLNPQCKVQFIVFEALKVLG